MNNHKQYDHVAMKEYLVASSLLSSVDLDCTTVSPLVFGYHLRMKGHSCHGSVSRLVFRGGEKVIF